MGCAGHRRHIYSTVICGEVKEEWGVNKGKAGPYGIRIIFVAPDASRLVPGCAILVTEIGFHSALADGCAIFCQVAHLDPLHEYLEVWNSVFESIEFKGQGDQPTELE